VAATADVRHKVSKDITRSFSVLLGPSRSFSVLLGPSRSFSVLLGDVYVVGTEGIDGVALIQQSLVSHLGEGVQYFLTAAILLFAFSSIIYDYYLGENAMTVMTKNPAAIHTLPAIVFLGAVAPGATPVFFFSDPMMAVLAVVNLLALIMLFPIAKRLLNDFRNQLKTGVVRPMFDPDKFPELDIGGKAWTSKEKEK
jgi:AGCS family alanine or glycine:cation symporter